MNSTNRGDYNKQGAQFSGLLARSVAHGLGGEEDWPSMGILDMLYLTLERRWWEKLLYRIPVHIKAAVGALFTITNGIYIAITNDAKGKW